MSPGPTCCERRIVAKGGQAICRKKNQSQANINNLQVSEIHTDPYLHTYPYMQRNNMPPPHIQKKYSEKIHKKGKKTFIPLWILTKCMGTAMGYVPPQLPLEWVDSRFPLRELKLDPHTHAETIFFLIFVSGKLGL